MANQIIVMNNEAKRYKETVNFNGSLQLGLIHLE